MLYKMLRIQGEQMMHLLNGWQVGAVNAIDIQQMHHLFPLDTQYFVQYALNNASLPLHSWSVESHVQRHEFMLDRVTAAILFFN